VQETDRPALERLRSTLRGGSRPSPSYRLLADYALQHPDHVAFKTARELGEAVGVSEATVIRFAHHLSYPGFPEFQRDCQQMLSDELEHARELKRRSLQAAGEQPAPAPAVEPFVLGASAPRRVRSSFAYEASQMVDSDVPVGGFGDPQDR
jgi:DNA-binding MurR/RpiR family transcriptional regulator